jgi:hypothetical protein
MNLLIKLCAVSNETFVVVGFISLFLRRNLICFGVALPGFLTGLFFLRAAFSFSFSIFSLCRLAISSSVTYRLLYLLSLSQFIFAMIESPNICDIQI